MRTDLKRRLSKLERRGKTRNPNRVFCFSPADTEAEQQRKCKAQALEGPCMFAPDYGSDDAWEVAASRQQSELMSQLQRMHAEAPVEPKVDPRAFVEVAAPRPKRNHSKMKLPRIEKK